MTTAELAKLITMSECAEKAKRTCAAPPRVAVCEEELALPTFHDSLGTMKLAAQQANSIDPDKLREALENLQTPKGCLLVWGTQS